MPQTPLHGLITREIAADGPMSLERYMSLCLAHPEHGYYRTRDPLGRAGDFTTAPEISQTFGELLGLWAAAVQATAGGDLAVLRLVELGPGRGTLAADALRALGKALPGTRVELHLIETSPVLRQRQEQVLAGHAPRPVWHADIGTLPQEAAIVLANEFFDALPVRQFERTAQGWCERRVGLTPDGASLRWGLNPEPDSRLDRAAPTGAVMTVPAAALDMVRALSRRLTAWGGAVLAIDYGHVRPGFGDSLQAIAGHRFVDPFADPGEVDLTTHVDFAALAQAAQAEGARVHGPVDQRDFLLALGLRARTDRLKAAAPEQANTLEAAFQRLTDPGQRGMGGLFKALCLAHPGLATPPGFPAAP